MKHVFPALLVLSTVAFAASLTIGGKNTIAIRTVEEYVTLASRGQPRHGFSEREIARTSEAFGNIVQVFSTYEAHRDSTDTRPTRGINSIQLFYDGAPLVGRECAVGQRGPDEANPRRIPRAACIETLS